MQMKSVIIAASKINIYHALLSFHPIRRSSKLNVKINENRKIRFQSYLRR